MKLRIGLTQRVGEDIRYGEKYDSLDQRWSLFMEAVGARPVPIPNGETDPIEFIKDVGLAGAILTGGNDLAQYGGNAKERDVLEARIIEYACSTVFPVIGVCRGMQVIHSYFGGELERVDGHAGALSSLSATGNSRVVNSYHNYGFRAAHANFVIQAVALDGIIEAFSHRSLSIHGIMWHPERNSPFENEDIVFFRQVLLAKS